MRYINLIVVHCSATKPSMDIGADEIYDWHVNGNGWSDIGYHWVIRRSGQIQTGRPIERAGAHTKGHNSNSIGICLVGGIDELGNSEDNFTPEQYNALAYKIGELEDEYKDVDDICGHRDLSPDVDGDGEVEQHEWVKDCPCFDVREFIINNM